MTRPALRRLFAAALLAAVVPASAAHAQAGVKSLDQYPSFIELQTLNPDSSVTVLRCGYIATGDTIAIDPNFAEISTINSSKGTYQRLQHIEDYVISTTPAPPGALGLHLELVHGSDPIIAKLCQTDTNTDTISNCQPTDVNQPAAQILADDRMVGTQCVSLIEQAKPQSNPADASPEKTRTFMDGLRAKIQMLNAP